MEIRTQQLQNIFDPSDFDASQKRFIHYRVILLLLLCFSPSIFAESIEGVWQTTYGEVAIKEEFKPGQRTFFWGRYRQELGVVSGYFDGKVARGIFVHTDPKTGKLRNYRNNYGTFEWVVSQDSQTFKGYWNWGREPLPANFSREDRRWDASRVNKTGLGLTPRQRRFASLHFIGADKATVKWMSATDLTPKHLKFDWAMPDRYGPDKNENGIVDLPNSYDYVNNLGDVPAGHVPHCAKNNTCGDTPLFAVDIFLEKNPELNLFYENANANFIKWEVSGENIPTTFLKGARNRWYFSEGRYRVSVEIENDPASKIIRTIDVKDHYIAVIGDSFAAGEGAPERQFDELDNQRSLPKPERPVAMWADPGFHIPTTWVKDKNNVQVKRPDWVKMKREPQKYSRLFENMQSHRSSYTHASQLARSLEIEDKKSSVTFVNLAQSGATIGVGVLDSYEGVGAGAESGREPMMADLRCDISFYTKRGMCPQYAQLNRLTRSRVIDHLYMSIGGNDVGFANIIGLLMIAFQGDIKIPAETNGLIKSSSIKNAEVTGTVNEILNAVKTGLWNEFDTNLFEEKALAPHARVETPGLNRLLNKFPSNAPRTARGYGNMNQYLRSPNSVTGKPLTKEITLIPPPFFGGFDVARTGGPNLAGYEHIRNDDFGFRYCRAEVDIPYDTVTNYFAELDPEEILWTEYNVLTPLVDKMKKAANRYRWNIVTYNKSLYNHGLCASSPNPSLLMGRIPLTLPSFEDTASAWYNHPDAGAGLPTGNAQTNTGMFHPNALGYTYAYKRLKHHLKKDTGLGDTFRDVFNVDKDDQMEEIALKRDSVKLSKFELNSDDDVALFSNLQVPVNADITVSVTRKSNTISQGCAAINVFDQRGQVLASSTKKATLASTNVAAVRDYSGEGCFTSFNRNHVQGVDANGLMRKTRSRVSLYAAKDVDCASTATRPIYFGVSSDENLFYDPVSGRGDIPIDDIRESYGFKGTVTLSIVPAAVCAK